MPSNSKKLRLATAALVVAAATVSGVATPALASSPSVKVSSASVKAGSSSAKVAGTASAVGFPGEANEQWHPETYSGGQIYSGSTPGEAHDNHGNVLHAWRGNGNDNIWISLNNGNAYELPTATAGQYATTSVPPTVIWTDDGSRGNFRIFHTGTDGHVYQTRIQLDTNYQLPATIPGTTQIPNDTRTSANLSVGAAALPNNSYMLAWNSQSDDSVWTMFYNGATATFGSPSVVPGALTKVSPALAAQVDTDNNDPAPWNQVVLAFTGTNDTLYMARQQYGTSKWTSPVQVHANGTPGTNKAPSIALSRNGYGAISFTEGTTVEANPYIGSYQISRDGGWSGEYQESTYTTLPNGRSPLAVVDGTTLYYVINDGTCKWKKVYDFAANSTPGLPQW